MASITLTIPDAIAQRVLNGFCGAHGYSDMVPDPANPGQLIQNPMTKVEFVRKFLLDVIRHDVKAYEGTVSRKAAEAKANEEIQL